MKKALKIGGIALSAVFVLLLVLPLLFKGKIIEQVKRVINENVTAVVNFDSFGLSFIRNFPNVSFRLEGLSVVGVDKFEGDTLASIEKFGVSVNLMSLLGGEGFEIKTVTIDQPNLLLKVLEDGSANWNITVPTTVEPETPVAEQQPVNFNIALRRFQISNANIVFDDAQAKMVARIKNFNHTLRGDFTADSTTLAIRNTSIESLFFSLGGIPYLNNVYVDFRADIGANLKESKFTFIDNTLRINDLSAMFEGSFSMPENAIGMDFVFSTPDTEFKSLLSLVPAIYAKNFEGLKTSGTFELNGHVRGIMDDNNIPGFGLNINVDNGMFQYPDLPASVTGVFIRTAITNPGGSADYTIVDVNRFDFNVAGNPIALKLNLQTPISDPQIDALLQGKLDLTRVKDFYPLDEGITLQGIITSDMAAKGRMSSIENKRYEEFIFQGQLGVNALEFASADFPQGVVIDEMSMSFSPQFAELHSFISRIGDSDFSATGRIDNILGFALSDQLLTGSFATRSEYFNLNQFMTETPAEPTPEAPAELSVIEIPANIDFTLRSVFDKLLFGDLEITNTNGTIRVVDQTARLENLRMNMLNGTLVLNGSYSTIDVTQPAVDFNLNISSFDIQQTFATFNTFQKLAPIGERAFGAISANINLKSALDQTLSPVLASLAGGGSLASSAIRVDNSPALVGLADNLRMEMFRSLNVRDLDVNFAFSDGRVNVEPFDIKFGNSNATIQGHHGFDQTINYVMNMAIPRTEFGGTANEALNSLISRASGRGLNITPGEFVNVGAAITGTTTQPQISLTLAQTAADLKNQFTGAIDAAIRDGVEQVEQQVQEVIEETRRTVSAEVERRAEQVITEAERQAENIKREAANTASTIRSEARTQAQRLEAEASGPIAKAAARRTGDQLIRTADQNATRLETEAETNANNIITSARERAERIRAGLE